jgi:alpha-L-fucosidase
MDKNGATVYGTRGGISPKAWGTVTVKGNTAFVHVLAAPKDQKFIFIPELKQKIGAATLFGTPGKIKIKQLPEGTFIYLDGVALDDVDTIIQLELK